MLPYTHAVTVIVPSGETSKVVLPMPYRGQLDRLVVKQTDGTKDGFSFDLLDREDACHGEVTSSSNMEDGVERLDRDLHKLQATKVVTATNDLSEQFNMGLAYINRDERDVNLGQPTRALYLDLLVNGSGDKRFQVAYTTTVDSL